MCVVQYYTTWRCGCPIRESDQGMLKACIHRLVDPLSSSCTVHVLPLADETDSSSQSGGKCDRASECSDDADSQASEDSGETINTSTEESRGPGSEQQEHAAKTTKEPACGEEDADDPEQTEDGPKKQTEAAAAAAAATPAAPIRCPRMCVYHELKFEDAAHAMWKSELQWLRTSLRRRRFATDPLHHHHYQARGIVVPSLAPLESHAAHLWDMYHVWKFFYGGNKRGQQVAMSLFAGSAARLQAFQDKVGKMGDNSDGAEQQQQQQQQQQQNSVPNETPDANNTQTILASKGASDAMQRLLEAGGADYEALRRGLEALLEPLRASLHPREMVG